MPIADPHCHTVASDGMVTPAELVEAAVKANVDLIAVTDHDTMACVKEVQQRGEGAGLVVVAGQEVTTKWPATTHVLAWFLEKPVKRGMSLEDTVAAIHDQDGLAIIPHPFMPVYFGSIQPFMLRAAGSGRRWQRLPLRLPGHGPGADRVRRRFQDRGAAAHDAAPGGTRA